MIIIYHKTYLVAKGIEALIKNHFIGQKILLSTDIEQVKTIVHSSDILICDAATFRYLEKNSNSFPEKILVVDKEQSVDFQYFIKLDSPKKVIEDILEKFLPQKEDEETSKLSEREKDIVRLVAKGLTNKEIADKLFLSIHTVTTHRKNISAKLGIRTISGLTTYAILNGLVNIDEIKN